MRRRRLLVVMTFVLSWWVTGSAMAIHFNIGSGSSFNLGSGSLDLGCSDVTISGTFDIASGNVVQVSDLTIDLGGTLEGGSGSIDVTGVWFKDPAGLFLSESGTVNLVDGCGNNGAAVYGDNDFATLNIVTSTGKTWNFESGSTQSVGTSFSAMGDNGSLAVLRSTSTGNEANFVITGTADIDWVDIDDIFISPSTVVIGPNSTTGSNLSGIELCGDIDGSLAHDAADVTMARDHLMGRVIGGDITLCNVIGAFDPLEGGADCNVDDIFVLERLAASLDVGAANACKP